jgi:hypothetical protein
MHPELRSTALASRLFVREQVRAPLTLVLLLVLPVVFVVAAAAVLGPFAKALGGSASGHAATALGAGWAAAFLAGALGFFQTVSSHEADQRLALAGLGAAHTAVARLASAFALALAVSATSLLTLVFYQGTVHPAHTALAILTFASIYLAIGIAVGAVVHDALAGSLAVVFIFILDVFSGPGMTPSAHGLATVLSPSRKAAELLLAAGAGQNSPTSDWVAASIATGVAVTVALSVFWLAARRRS